MSNKRTLERDLLRGALGPTEGCPPLEKLESALVHGSPGLSPEVSQHLKTCGYCQTELHLLRDFQEAGAEKDSEEVRKVVKQLRGRSKEIFQQRSSAKAREPWWSRRLRIQWLVPATLGMAALLIVAGGMLNRKERLSQPNFKSAVPAGPEVYRSGEFALLNSSGDLPEPPTTLRWESVPEASKYEVSLREVDRTELWKSQTEATHIEIPVSVQQKVVPAKTVFFEVIAYDTTGRKVGDTGLVRMRVVPH